MFCCLFFGEKRKRKKEKRNCCVPHVSSFFTVHFKDFSNAETKNKKRKEIIIDLPFFFTLSFEFELLCARDAHFVAWKARSYHACVSVVILAGIASLFAFQYHVLAQLYSIWENFLFVYIMILTL